MWLHRMSLDAKNLLGESGEGRVIFVVQEVVPDQILIIPSADWVSALQVKSLLQSYLANICFKSKMSNETIPASMDVLFMKGMCWSQQINAPALITALSDTIRLSNVETTAFCLLSSTASLRN